MHEQIDETYMIGWSVGGAYTIGFSLARPHKVLGLVVGDYFPIVPAFSREWLEDVLAEPGDIAPAAARGIVEEAEQVSYVERLAELEVPLLVLRGTREDALLKREALRLFDGARDKRVVEVDCGHYVFGCQDARRACVELVSSWAR